MAKLDVVSGARTGVDGRSAGQPLYVTGNLPAVTTTALPGADSVGGAEFKHSNQTQGIGIGFDGIYAAGSAVSQDFNLKQKGAGVFREIWQAPTGLVAKEYRNQIAAAVINMGFRFDYYVRNLVVGREYLYDPVGNEVDYKRIWTQRVASVDHTGMTLQVSALAPTGFTLNIGNDVVNKDKINLYNVGATGQQFMGFGIENGAVTYQTYSTWNHRWYNAPDNATANLLMEMNSNGRFGVGNSAGDQQEKIDVRGGSIFGNIATTLANRAFSITAGVHHFTAGVAVGTAAVAAETIMRLFRQGQGGVIFSSAVDLKVGKYEDGGSTNARTIFEIWLAHNSTWTTNTKVIHFRSDGRINTPLLPTHLTDITAGVGGLVAGDWYKTPTGELRIKL